MERPLTIFHGPTDTDHGQTDLRRGYRHLLEQGISRFVLVALLTLGAWPAHGEVVFVDASRPPGGDGTSWSNACNDLQDGLDRARQNSRVDQVWVAEGTYRPDRGTHDRLATFTLVSGVALLGGFAGGETSADERDPGAHSTVLSGDLQQNDQAGFVGYGDNSQHVVSGSDLSHATIDGFTVRGGNADLDGDLQLGGGGMLVTSTGQSGDTTSVVVHHCIFRENSAGRTFAELGNFGGGLLLRASSGTVADCRFERNRANNGGALGLTDRNLSGVSVDVTVSVHDCSFNGNVVPTQAGGAMFSAIGRSALGSQTGILIVRRCQFERNTAGYWAAWLDQNATFLTIEDCAFRENSSDVHGGALGIMQTGGPDVDPARIRRCLFEKNHTDGAGGGIWIGAADAEVTDCIFRGNSALSGAGLRSGTDFTETGSQDLTVINSLFEGNSAAEAAAISSADNPILHLVNDTFVDNEATGGLTGGVLTQALSVDVDNGIFWENTGVSGPVEEAQIRHFDGLPMSINYCLVMGLTGNLGGLGNFDAPPLFVDEKGADGVPGTGDEDLGLSPGSPCIDAADNEALPDSIKIDLAGKPRFVDDPNTADTGSGDPPIVDLGAYEFQAGLSEVAGDLTGQTGEQGFAFPNPTSGKTNLFYYIRRPSWGDVRIHDASGRLVRVLLLPGRLSAGPIALTWDGRDDAGRATPAGVYYARLEGAGCRITTRIVRTR